MNLTRFLLAAALGGAAACASSSGSTATTLPSADASTNQAPAGPHGDSRLLTEADLAAATQSNLYDIVQALRPRWLRITSVGIQSPQAYTITIFLDDTKLGEPETLRNLGIGGVKAIRYYDASASQQKFPGRDLGPVIQVIRL